MGEFWESTTSSYLENINSYCENSIAPENALENPVAPENAPEVVESPQESAPVRSENVGVNVSSPAIEFDSTGSWILENIRDLESKCVERNESQVTQEKSMSVELKSSTSSVKSMECSVSSPAQPCPVISANVENQVEFGPIRQKLSSGSSDSNESELSPAQLVNFGSKRKRASDDQNLEGSLVSLRNLSLVDGIEMGLSPKLRRKTNFGLKGEPKSANMSIRSKNGHLIDHFRL